MTAHNSPTTRSLPWLMWMLGALFYCYETFLGVSPNVMTNELMGAFNVDAAALGLLAGCYFYAYAGMQIPVGLLLDRLGPRRLLTIATAICAIGCWLFGSTHTFVAACLGRFFIGLGSAFAAIGCLHITASWLPLRRFSLLTGVMLTIGMLGAVFAQAPLAILVAHIGWRYTMVLFGFVGAAISILIWFIVRDKPIPTTHKEEHKQLPILKALILVIHNPQNWIGSIYGGLMFLSTPVFGGLWGVTFLMQSYSITRTLAATLVSLLFIGWAVGAPLFGWLSEALGRRKPVLATGSIGALIALLCVIYVPGLSLIMMGVFLFLFGFFTSAFLPIFAVVREINPTQTNSTALGFINTFNMLGIALGQPFIGLILDQGWHGKIVDNVRIYSTSDFHIALMVMPICITIALITLPFIRETHCQPASR